MPVPKDVMRLFPLHAGTLKPRFPGWPAAAVPVSDTDTITNWRNLYTENGEGPAWGVATGPSNLIVVDLDVKHGHDGIAEWQHLQLEHGPAPVTFSVRTKSGGRHLYFEGLCRCSAGKIAPGVDIRSDGGYVVCPGVHGYTIETRVEIAPAPDWLLRLVKPPRAKIERPTVLELEKADLEADLVVARRIMARHPVPVEGERNQNLFQLACKMRDQGLSAGMCETLMDEWMLENNVQDEGHKLGAIVENAWKYAENAPGVHSVAVAYEPVPEDALTGLGDEEEDESNPPEGKDWSNGEIRDLSEVACGREIMAVNREWFMALRGGKMRWFRREFDPALKHWVYRDYDEKSFAASMADRFLPLMTGDGDGTTKMVPLSKFWISSPHRRYYKHGLFFDPESKGDHNRLNLWQGFALDAKSPPDGSDGIEWGTDPSGAPIVAGRGWNLLFGHIWDNIADHNPDWMRWILGWMAFLVQHPGQLPEVALVLRGEKGSGKSILGDYLARIFGDAGRTVAGNDLLSGRFTGHLKEAVFVCVNEVGWAGNMDAADRLKDRITNKVITIEKKGQDAVFEKNCLHLMITTNHDWVVHSSSDERRFAVFDVLSNRVRDYRFWKRLVRQMDQEAGLQAMLHELLNWNLGDWHPREDIPQTEALREQALASMSPEEAFLRDLWESGEIPAHWIQSGTSEDWHENRTLYILRDPLMEAFWTQNPSRRRSERCGTMGRILKRVGAVDFRPCVEGGRTRVWVIPGHSDPRWRRIG